MKHSPIFDDENEIHDYLIDFQFTETPNYVKDIRLYQVGKKFCNEYTVVSAHMHANWFELTVILDGKGKIYANQSHVSVSEGDVFLSYPNEVHKIESDSEKPLKYSFLAFCLDDSSFLRDFETIAQTYYECSRRIFRNPAIAPLIESIITEMPTVQFERETVLFSALQQIFIYTCRAFLPKQESNPPKKTVEKHDILCYKIMRYVDYNLFSIRSADEIAEYLHYNYAYLARVFKETTKGTITQYLTNRKLERAKVLIAENILPLNKIAEILNYASIYSFSKSFKLHFGISPSEYKRQRIKN